jgi:hypothetical protein
MYDNDEDDEDEEDAEEDEEEEDEAELVLSKALLTDIECSA